jgi:hypothetical protein
MAWPVRAVQPGLPRRSTIALAGGIGDSPTNPNPACTGGAQDDELCNLALGNSANTTPFIKIGDPSITFDTSTPSFDDNIFAIFFSSQFDVVLGPPGTGLVDAVLEQRSGSLGTCLSQRLAARRPRSADDRVVREPAFVLEDEPGAAPASVLLTRGHRVPSAAKFRRARRVSGTGGGPHDDTELRGDEQAEDVVVEARVARVERDRRVPELVKGVASARALDPVTAEA